MVYCKPYDDEVIKSFVKLHQFMRKNYPHIEIYVDDWLVDEVKKITGDNEHFDAKIFKNSGEESRREIDYIITLGGDGTILWASK